MSSRRLKIVEVRCLVDGSDVTGKTSLKRLGDVLETSYGRLVTHLGSIFWQS